MHGKLQSISLFCRGSPALHIAQLWTSLLLDLRHFVFSLKSHLRWSRCRNKLRFTVTRLHRHTRLPHSHCQASHLHLEFAVIEIDSPQYPGFRRRWLPSYDSRWSRYPLTGTPPQSCCLVYPQAGFARWRALSS